jgi:hypothetical protein
MCRAAVGQGRSSGAAHGSRSNGPSAASSSGGVSQVSLIIALDWWEPMVCVSVTVFLFLR